MDKKKIAVIGAGPKAIAIAAKAHVLKQQNILDVDITLFDELDVAANWDGANGFTDGNHKLGTAPEKDIGFPYNSIFGREVNREIFRYSWQNYLVDKGRFASYIDRGKIHPFHEEWARYLRWVKTRINSNVLIERVTQINPANDKISLVSVSKGQQHTREFSGVVVTGPGRPIKIGNPSHEWSENIIDGRVFWQRIAVFRELNNGKIAIIGGGETAASIAVCLTQQAPNLSIDIVNRHGTLYTRGESFHENELYTNPDKWVHLDETDRDDFMRRTDRGVFSVESKKIIDHTDKIRVITGNVTHIGHNRKAVAINVYRQNGSTVEYVYDKVIVAVGFDPHSFLDLLPDHLRRRHVEDKNGHKIDLYKYIRKHVDYHFRVPVPLDSYKCINLHMPMLAGLNQGPGFPNLSCLGILSDRVLSAYTENPIEDTWHCRSKVDVNV